MRDLQAAPRIYSPRTLSGLLAPGEHKFYVAVGTPYSVNVEYSLHGIQVYVTGPTGWDKRFESFTGNPMNQAPAWAHATKLLVAVFGDTPAEVNESTPAPIAPAAITLEDELADEADDLLTVTAAASINAHRERKTAPAFVVNASREWASRGQRAPMTSTQAAALEEATLLPSGTVHRSKEHTITTLRALIRQGWAEAVEGTRENRHTLTGARITRAGRIALAAYAARRTDTLAGVTA